MEFRFTQFYLVFTNSPYHLCLLRSKKRLQRRQNSNQQCISGPHLWKLRAVSDFTGYTRVSEVASNYFLFPLNQHSDHRCRLTKSTPASLVLPVQQRLLDFSSESIPRGISSPLSISPTPRKKWWTSFPFILLWYKYLCILFLTLFLSAISFRCCFTVHLTQWSFVRHILFCTAICSTKSEETFKLFVLFRFSGLGERIQRNTAMWKQQCLIWLWH